MNPRARCWPTLGVVAAILILSRALLASGATDFAARLIKPAEKTQGLHIAALAPVFLFRGAVDEQPGRFNPCPHLSQHHLDALMALMSAMNFDQGCADSYGREDEGLIFI